MAVAQRRGYGWSLPGMGAGRPGGGASSQIRIFSAKGMSAPGVLGTSPLPQIGTPIPGTNLVYIRPRLSQDELGGSGGSPFADYRWPGEGRGIGSSRFGGVRASASVHYTNPEFSFYRENRRSPSIGMGGAGQMGLTMDVPYQSEAPGWFSIA